MSKVLLVEDDIALRDIYTDAFKAEGHDVITASDGNEALAKAKAESPDLMLLDIMMPKMSGFEVLTALKGDEQTKKIHVVVLSALSQKRDIDTGLSIGADAYLIKAEITLPEVLEKARELLEKK